MTSLEGLQVLKDKVLERMDAARRAGEMEELIKCARMIQDLDNVFHSSKATIDRITAGLASRQTNVAAPQESRINDSVGGAALSRKARGRARRDEYVRKLSASGVHLGRLKGRAYQTASGKRVGISYASEKLPNKWWMGLPDEYYDILVLLCETDSGEVLDFVLPADFVRRIWSRLTLSRKQREWHVERRGANYELEPKKEFGQINQFLSHIALLS